MVFLILPRIKVQAANAFSCSWLINSAPVFAINMFVHNLVHVHLKNPIHGYENKKSLEYSGTEVAIILHHSKLLGEYFGKEYDDKYFRFKYFLQQRRGAVFIDKDDYSSKNKNALSLQPTASETLCISLILKLEAEVDIEEVKQFLKSGRIAGGSIISHGNPIVAETLEDVNKVLKSGFWIRERMDLMRRFQNPLDSLFDSIGNKVFNEDGSQATWLGPTVLGYRTITHFKTRSGSREGFRHAYAEPMVGLVQFQSVAKHKNLRIPFWRYFWLDKKTFIVTNAERKN